VYKWGWDQKRKKYGVEEAERMRQIEHQMDQANAARRQKINSQNGITEKEDLYQESYSDQSENSEDESSDSQKYQTQI
jgi:E3 ubiquitin-protein ligase DOA10